MCSVWVGTLSGQGQRSVRDTETCHSLGRLWKTHSVWQHIGQQKDSIWSTSKPVYLAVLRRPVRPSAC